MSDWRGACRIIAKQQHAFEASQGGATRCTVASLTLSWTSKKFVDVGDEITSPGPLVPCMICDRFPARGVTADRPGALG